MTRTLKGSKQPYPNMENMKGAAQNMDPAMMNNVQDAINKYGNKSEGELMGELMNAKHSGLIDPGELAGVAQKIAPMLTPEQRQRLDSVLKQLQQ